MCVGGLTGMFVAALVGFCGGVYVTMRMFPPGQAAGYWAAAPPVYHQMAQKLLLGLFAPQ
jgi:uncharacterized protein YneF (UPF0154 family)